MATSTMELSEHNISKTWGLFIISKGMELSLGKRMLHMIGTIAEKTPMIWSSLANGTHNMPALPDLDGMADGTGRGSPSDNPCHEGH